MTTLDAFPGDVINVKATPVIPSDPPPVEPPPGAKTVRPAGWNQKYLDGLVDGDTVMLYGGEYNSPFLIVRRKVTLQAMPGETVILTRTGRPDLLYHEVDGVVRDILFNSQSTGFDDSQGAALVEVRSPSVPIGLVWYDRCGFSGTAKMSTREQIAYIADKGKTMTEVRFTDCVLDGNGTQGFGIHPYSGPSPKLVTVQGCELKNFPRNAAVLNAASAAQVKVDRCTFSATVTYARGMYGPVDVSNSKLSGTPQGTVNDRGGNTR
jgi:hypothetical protein